MEANSANDGTFSSAGSDSMTHWDFTNNLPQTALLGLSLCALSLLVIRWRPSQDSREPPYIHSTIPFVGHLIGMIRYGAKYFEYVNKKTKHGIFTLPILSTRNYIVADATLAGIIQRNNKTLSFYSLIVEVTRRLIAFDEKATRITFDNINGERGPGGLMELVHEMTNRHLGPGKNLDAITSIQMEKTGETLDAEVFTGDGIETDLYAWLRHVFSLCNAQAIYGPENIFAVHPELEAEFWKFEEGMLGLVIDVVPQVTARKAYYARKRVLDGLVEYVKTERYKKASPLIQERVQTNLTFGIGEEMSGHAELILMFAILGNAVPSNFWLIANIFSRPELLDRIRTEVEAAVTIQTMGDESFDNYGKLCTVSAKIIARSCPLLYSCYRETLRDMSLLTSPRLVMEDTVVADRYLLRKNSVVQIAGGVLHHSTNVWGSDANEFNPERFLTWPESATDSSTSDNSKSSKMQSSPLPRGVPSAGFRAFGGGTVICPGRHFAQAELMALAAVLAIGFEITKPEGSRFEIPDKDEERIPLAMVKPKWDPRVRLRRRRGWEDIKWSIDV